MLYCAGRKMAASLGLVVLALVSPSVCEPLLPTYAIVSESVGVRDCWTLAFQASRVGRRNGLGRALELTAYPGLPRRPFAGTAIGVGAGGPWARVNAELVIPPVLVTCWLERVGRFCVAACPKMEPNTPISKLRP